MLQFSYLPNGDLVVTCDTTDGLIKEFFVQLPQGMMYVPRSYVPKSTYNYTCRMTLTSVGNAPVLAEPNVDIYDVSPVTRKLIARNTESFFAALQDQYSKGYTYSEGSAKMGVASNSAVLQKIDASSQAVAEAKEADTEKLDTFNLDTALALSTKKDLVTYCEKYGLTVDSSKTTASIKNWLKAQKLAGN